LLRISSFCLNCDSNAEICWLRAGCAMCRMSAALVMLPTSTIFTKDSRRRVSTARPSQSVGGKLPVDVFGVNVTQVSSRYISSGDHVTEFMY